MGNGPNLIKIDVDGVSATECVFELAARIIALGFARRTNALMSVTDMDASLSFRTRAQEVASIPPS